jgi:probable rRNA maturation factor
MKIFVNNLSEFEEDIRKLAQKVVKREKLKGELSITFVDDEKMKEMNKKYTNRDSVTDVLSFGFDDMPELMGDIYISVPQAERQKEGDLLSELKLLAVHGILHLAGYDDKTARERRIMREKEKYYLKQ